MTYIEQRFLGEEAIANCHECGWEQPCPSMRDAEQACADHQCPPVPQAA